MWLKLHIYNADNTMVGAEARDGNEVMVNMRNIKRVMQANKDGCKLVFNDGEAVQVTESYRLVQNTLEGELTRSGGDINGDGDGE